MQRGQSGGDIHYSGILCLWQLLHSLYTDEIEISSSFAAAESLMLAWHISAPVDWNQQGQHHPGNSNGRRVFHSYAILTARLSAQTANLLNHIMSLQVKAQQHWELITYNNQRNYAQNTRWDSILDVAHIRHEIDQGLGEHEFYNHSIKKDHTKGNTPSGRWRAKQKCKHLALECLLVPR